MLDLNDSRARLYADTLMECCGNVGPKKRDVFHPVRNGRLAHLAR